MTSVLRAIAKPIKAGAQGGPIVKSNDPVTPNSSSTTKKSNGKRKSASLPSETVEYLKAWMMSPEHIAHPYPTEQEKVEIMKDTKIELKQLTNWFVNNRKRYWKPRVEARLQQQAQAAQAAVQAHAAAVAAVSAANSLPQQQQMVAVPSPEVPRAGLVSPSIVGFKYATQPNLPPQVSSTNPPLMAFSAPSSPPMLTQQSFASSPLSVAAQIVEQRRNPIVPVPATTTVRAVRVNEPSPSSAASVSASEGEISDSGNSSDDASSDGATILGTHLKFIDLKMKKNSLKTRASSIASIVSASDVPLQTANARPSYTRNVSFCSLDKVSFEVSSGSQEIDGTCSVNSSSKKRSLEVEKDDDLSPVVPTTTAVRSNVQDRKRFRTVSIDLWRKKCRDATTVNDETLPSLEEASRMFGFTAP